MSGNTARAVFRRVQWVHAKNSSAFVAAMDADDPPGSYDSPVRWMFGPVGLHGKEHSKQDIEATLI